MAGFAGFGELSRGMIWIGCKVVIVCMTACTSIGRIRVSVGMALQAVLCNVGMGTKQRVYRIMVEN